MRPIRYSINVTLDGCGGHRSIPADDDLHQYAVETLDRVDAMLLGTTTYRLMEDGWRHPVPPGTRPEWMEPFAEKINAMPKYVVSSTLDSVDWNVYLLHGDLETSVRALKEQPGPGIGLGGVQLPLALAELGLIDEYDFLMVPRIAGHGPALLAGLSEHVDLALVEREELDSGAV